MSLTSHLKDAQSPIRRWLVAQLPNLEHGLSKLRQDLPDLATRTIRPVQDVPWPTLGMAFDYRARYYFAVTPPQKLVAWQGATKLVGEYLNREEPTNVALSRNATDHEGLQISGDPDLRDPEVAHLAPAAFFTTLAELTDELRPAQRRLAPRDEERLDRACVVLALLEMVYRQGQIWPGSPLEAYPLVGSASALLALPPDHWVDDLIAVSYAFHDAMADQLARPAVLNPTFAGSRDVGGADADLIVEGCLLDIKTTINPRLEAMWLLQVLGYTLLDYEDEFQIRSVGICFARQSTVVSWPLTSILDLVAPTSHHSLADLRSAFRSVASQARPERAGLRGSAPLTVRAGGNGAGSAQTGSGGATPTFRTHARKCRVCSGTGVCPCTRWCIARQAEADLGAQDPRTAWMLRSYEFHDGRTCHVCHGKGSTTVVNSKPRRGR